MKAKILILTARPCLPDVAAGGDGVGGRSAARRESRASRWCSSRSTPARPCPSSSTPRGTSTTCWPPFRCPTRPPTSSGRRRRGRSHGRPGRPGGRPAVRDPDRGRQPRVRRRLPELDRRHQSDHRPWRHRAADSRRTHRRRCHGRHHRQRHPGSLGPAHRRAAQPARRLEGLRERPPQARTTTPATAPSSPGSSPATAPPPCRSTRAASPRTQFRGVAPGANIVAIKVLDKFGQCRASDVVAAIAWAIRHKDQYHIRVLNISVGGNIVGPVATDPMATAVEAAWKAGIVVVCGGRQRGRRSGTAASSRRATIRTSSPSALSTRSRRWTPATTRFARYSSIGPTLFDEFAKPDLVAPGNRLIC